MNPPCAKCKKIVYPVEKFNCLDKTWHKACFRCASCDLKLTMKTYKGYNKIPYCVVHYPTTKFTAVADTPEAKRLQQQQKNQSEIVYRKDKQEALKSFTQVADSVANRTAAKSNKLASNIGYQTAPSDVGHEGRARPSEVVNRQPTHIEQQQLRNEEMLRQQHIAPARVAAQPQRSPPPQQQTYQPPPPVAQPPPPAPAPAPAPAKTVGYKAQFDYAAADDDEISFVEGDVIIDTTIIDEGWMEGRNKRTGQYGMLPSNYVEKI